MKLWILSDLHIDVNHGHPFELPHPRPLHDAVIIAGDICQGMVEGVRFIVEQGLNARPVLYIGGNHEFYGRDRWQELRAGRAEAAKHPNIHLLERDRLVIGGVEFLGCTLWTDYTYAGAERQAAAMQWAARRMSDHRVITVGNSAWSPAHALEEHLGSRAWLADQLANGPAAGRVVITHHAPSRKSVQERYRDGLLSAAFASDLEDLVVNAGLWVHGHLHAPADYYLGDTRVVANPRGYIRLGEHQAFDPACTIDIDAA
jgi:Icc-related predicted phosphoesterase